MNTTIHTADVLIIGGAASGLTAAITAKQTEKDLDILVVDKACASKGWSGKAARTAGLISFVSEKNDPEEFVRYCLKEIGFYLNDQNVLRDMAYNSRRLVEHLETWGVSVTRDENGKIDGAQWPFPWVTAGIDPDMCLHMSKCAKNLGVHFLDRIVISDLFKDGERIAGACGFSLEDGGFHVFSANSVILASGSQNFDITPIWCGTGFAQAAAYRAGAEMRNAEFANMGDFARKDPNGWIYYGMHGGAHTGHDHLYAKGENISQKWRPGFHSSMDAQAAYAWYKETVAGNGPIMIDMRKFKEEGGGGEFFKFHPEALRRYMRHHEVAGYPFDNQFFETVPGVISELSCVRVNRQMATTVPGLFAVGDAGGSGSGRAGAAPAPPAKIHGTGLLNALFMGEKGGAAAAVCAKALKGAGVEYLPKEAEVEAMRQATYSPMARKKGVSPRAVIHRVQDAMAPCDYVFVKTEARMREALDIVKDADAMLSDMRAENYQELCKCVDARSMVLGAELFYRASMMRKESRGFHLREDYPEQNDEQWLKWIIIRNAGGEMRLTTEDIPIDTYDYQPEKTIQMA